MNLSRIVRSLTPAEFTDLRLLIAIVKNRNLRAKKMGAARNPERASKRWIRETAKLRGKARAHRAFRGKRKKMAKVRREARAVA